MVLYPHAESIDENSDHDPSVEIFTFHNPLQFFPEAYPGPNCSILILHDPPPSAPTSPTSQISCLEWRQGSHLKWGNKGENADLGLDQ